MCEGSSKAHQHVLQAPQAAGGPGGARRPAMATSLAKRSQPAAAAEACSAAFSLCTNGRGLNSQTESRGLDPQA